VTEYRASPFTRSYVTAIKQARRDVDVYRSLLVNPSPDPDALDTRLLLAEAGQFVSDEGAGREFVTSVQDSVGAVFARIHADTGPVNTLTSSSGRVFVPVTNDNDVPVRVTVRLVSPHLRRSPATSTVLDARSSQTLSFDVQLTTTGRFPVEVQIASPSGQVIGRAKLVVRSTAYNQIALVITVGAAFVALAIWARRFVPRRTA
jgi:hypothetical protein